MGRTLNLSHFSLFKAAAASIGSCILEDPSIPYVERVTSASEKRCRSLSNSLSGAMVSAGQTDFAGRSSGALVGSSSGALVKSVWMVI
jgi:hypothetical protein